MLRGQSQVEFLGGLDAQLLRPWHIDEIKNIKIKKLWFACDHPGAMVDLERAADLTADFPIDKKRCYVLIGFNGERRADAERRLLKIYNLGFLPFASLYQGPGGKRKWTAEWDKIQKIWCRPAVFKKLYKDKVICEKTSSNI